MVKYAYKGSTKENHRKIISLGCILGIQNIRKMPIGDKIAEMANGGHEKAQIICAENPVFFTAVVQ